MKLTAIPRITLGLVSLAVCLLIAFDVLLNLFPSEAKTTAALRLHVANSLAIQAAALVQARDVRTVERTLVAVQSRDPDILSIGMRRVDGSLLAQAGDHLRQWGADMGGSNAMSVGILADEQRWGALEIAFRPLHRRAASDWLWRGPTKLIVLFMLSSTIVYYVFLRRMLHHLDPAAAVPERVRGAFDALTEGVLIVDPGEHVLLANENVRAMCPVESRDSLIGRKVSELAWLRPRHAALDGDEPHAAGDAPWSRAMRTLQPVRGRPFGVWREGVEPMKVVVNCSPLLDERAGVRGCLVTLDDVTALERSHEQLLDVLADLATSKEQLESKNLELEDLANRDPLSGCLNRRAFFAGLQRLHAQALRERGELICILADIDHFKSINDRFGHGIGDEAIKRFAQILAGSVRHDDLVGRYGGEEFCVVVAGMTLAQGLELGEQMRARLAADTSVGEAAGQAIALSASFGVTSVRLGAASEALLVEQADQAMYRAKQGGRNRVVAYGPDGQDAPRSANVEAVT